MTKKQFFVRAGILLLALVAIAATVASFVIGPRNIIGMLRYDTRREGTLKVGDPAPDVELIALGSADGSDRIQLRQKLRGRPLVLIFGSFT